MTESHVEQQVQQRLAAARIRLQAAQQRRDDLAEARRHGIARRHAQKLAYLAEAEQRAAERQDDEQDGQDDNDTTDSA